MSGLKTIHGIPPKHWKLKTKVILHVFLIGTLMALMLILLYLHTQRRLIRNMARQKAELLGMMIERSISSPGPDC